MHFAYVWLILWVKTIRGDVMDFDKVIDRHKTGSVKWDLTEELFNSPDALPMWVADMDFDNPEPVKKALKSMIDNDILGYTFPKDSLYDSIINWQNTHHDMHVEKEMILFSPGVLSSIAVSVQSFTEAGDTVLVHDPVYPPFCSIVEKNNRNVLTSALILKDGQYVMDFEEIESILKRPDVTLFILSNPHNPGGRVWNEHELTKLVNLCIRHKVILISDEIHSDLVYSGHTCISPVTLNDQYKKWVVTLHSATKTFNIAGVKLSYAIIYDQDLKNRFVSVQHQTELDAVNTFGMIATEAAFNHGESWRSELMAYLTFNRTYIMNFFDQYLPHVSYMAPQSTYLFWFDASTLNIEPECLKNHFAEKGKIALNDGISYGQNGKCFMRLNFAVPESVLKDGLNRIRKVFEQ